jgi:hypothetical protein
MPIGRGPSLPIDLSEIAGGGLRAGLSQMGLHETGEWEGSRRVRKGRQVKT